MRYSLNRTKLVLIACLFAIIFGCGRSTIKGAGAAKQETRQIKAFTGVEIDGNYAILGNIGKPEQLVISTNPNILPYIKSSVESGILTVKNDHSVDLQPTVAQNLWFTTDTLSSLHLSGNTQFQMTNLNSPALECTFNGSNKTVMQGKVDKLKMVISGSANVNANSVEVKDAEIEINGSGTVTVNVSDHLKVKINGDGKVVYSNGQPKIEQTINGSGQVVSAFGTLEQHH